MLGRAIRLWQMSCAWKWFESLWSQDIELSKLESPALFSPVLSTMETQDESSLIAELSQGRQPWDFTWTHSELYKKWTFIMFTTDSVGRIHSYSITLSILTIQGNSCPDQLNFKLSSWFTSCLRSQEYKSVFLHLFSILFVFPMSCWMAHIFEIMDNTLYFC